MDKSALKIVLFFTNKTNNISVSRSLLPLNQTITNARNDEEIFNDSTFNDPMFGTEVEDNVFS